MAQKKQSTTKSRGIRKRSITCKKDHGHLVCWMVTKNAPSKKRILIDLVLPNARNNHRPHLIRRSSLVAVTLVLIGLQVTYNYLVAKQSQILGYATNVSAQAVIDDLNDARAANGKSVLTLDPKLSRAAGLKADDMFTKDYWSHNAPDGTKPWHWFNMAGYEYRNAGENLAKDFKTSEGVVKAWLASESHRENMLNDRFENIGVAAVNGKLGNSETTLVVALFGTKKSVLAATDEGTVSTTSHSGTTVLSHPAQISALISPISIFTLAVLISILVVSLLTHWHYIKLPKKVRKSWYRHHALYTAAIALIAISYIAYIFTSGKI